VSIVWIKEETLLVQRVVTPGQGTGSWTVLGDDDVPVGPVERFLGYLTWIGRSLLRRRFASFRTIYLPTVARLADHGFELLPTAQRPHFTVRLWRADDQELGQLLAACGSPQPNPQYARSTIWQEDR
jgi:hypothetical protein